MNIKFLQKAASDYAKEKHVSIKNIKSLRGETLLYYAFLWGASYQQEQSLEILKRSESIDKLRKEIQDSKDAYQHAMNEADFAYRNISEREKELELLLKEK